MSPADTFEALRDRLDPRDVAEGEGLARRGRHFTCPACDGHLKAMSADGRGWYCVKCEARGDAVDVVSLIRRLQLADARSVALSMAGLRNDRTGAPPPPLRRPKPPAPPPFELDADDERERMRALRLAALHYAYLGGWVDGDAPDPEEHLRYVRDFADLRELELARALRALPIAHAYAERRLRALPVGKLPRDLRLLVGVAPTPRSGLAGYLRHLGGEDLERAGVRAGLVRADGSEALGGRLVYLWTDARGRIVYLTARAVPELTRPDAPKVLALPVVGSGADVAKGVPRPGVPFGLAAALELHDADPRRPVVIVEGEAQAFAGLAAGRPVVATGGVTRTRPDELARALGGRPAVVLFDVESAPAKQARTDRRAEALAAALGCRWVPSHTRLRERAS